MHAKTNSEVTSLAASSPTRSSPRGRPVYYVQSPSRDSHDGEKTTASVHSTPVLSPMGSPPHSHSYVGRHSRESSTSRFSGFLKSSSGKILSNDAARGGHRKSHKSWKEPFDAIEEEGLLDDDDNETGIPRRCYLVAFFLGFIILFSLFSLILWGASRPQKPIITMRSITFKHFYVSAGSDSTGVATEMISVNSTVKFTYRNTATFFGVHVTSTPVNLNYYQLIVGTGTMNYFYQSRKSQRTVAVVVSGNGIPMYGGGASLSSLGGNLTAPVDLKLGLKVRSRAYVLGKLVKPLFYKNIDCSIVFDSKKLNVPISLKNCTYD